MGATEDIIRATAKQRLVLDEIARHQRDMDAAARGAVAAALGRHDPGPALTVTGIWPRYLAATLSGRKADS